MYRMTIKKKYHKKRYFVGLFLLFVIILFIGSVFGWFYFRRRGVSRSLKPGNYDSVINEVAKRNMIDPFLLKAVIWKESRFIAGACGKKGEIGLMQLKRDASVEDWARVNKETVPCRGILFSPELNVEIGAWYLARAIKYWKTEGYTHFKELALCEYNAGRSTTKKWLPPTHDGEVISRISYPSTKTYVKAILNKYAEYCFERKNKTRNP